MTSYRFPLDADDQNELIESKNTRFSEATETARTAPHEHAKAPSSRESTPHVVESLVWAASAPYSTDRQSTDHDAIPITETPPVGWPQPIRREALIGLAGQVVRIIEPHSETDPVAILLQFLVAIGNVVGRKPYVTVESTKHCLNLFLTIVGDTAKARKGTSWGHINRIFEGLDGKPVSSPLRATWSERLVSGLASGEGLIAEVRDPNPNVALYDHPDPGVHDKRRIVIDTEFAATLKVLKREGNTLSPTIRNAWDGGDLKITTRNNPVRATGAHISIIGHITRQELLRELSQSDAANGFANRFLWACVRRTKLLPEGGSLTTKDIDPIISELRDVVGFGENSVELRRDSGCAQMWRDEYARLSEGAEGVFGTVIARAEAQVLRLSALYAVLDQSTVITTEHLTAALAVWEFCEASARFIFGKSVGDRTADRILDQLRHRSSLGMTRTAIRDFFNKNKAAAEITHALELLATMGLVRKEHQKGTGTKPVEVWYAV